MAAGQADRCQVKGCPTTVGLCAFHARAWPPGFAMYDRLVRSRPLIGGDPPERRSPGAADSRATATSGQQADEATAHDTPSDSSKTSRCLGRRGEVSP
jgi:hypothetical protein